MRSRGDFFTTYGVGTGVEKRWAGTPLLSSTAAVRLARLEQGVRSEISS